MGRSVCVPDMFKRQQGVYGQSVLGHGGTHSIIANICKITFKPS